MKYPYHSATKGNNSSINELPCDKVIIGNSIAFANDITSSIGLPKEFDICDVYYSEIAWSSGLKKFNSRVGTYTPLDAYYRRVNDIILQLRKLKKPLFIVAGKNEMKNLLSSNYCSKIKLNNSSVMLMSYNVSNRNEYETTENLLESIRERYNCVGDFMCGYGNTGRMFYEVGKDFVMSDYNKKCIGYIKKYYEAYSKA